MSKQEIKKLLEASQIELEDESYFATWKDNWDTRPASYDDAWNFDGCRLNLKDSSWLLKKLEAKKIQCICMCFLPLGMDGQEYKPCEIEATTEGLQRFIREVEEHRCIPWPG